MRLAAVRRLCFRCCHCRNLQASVDMRAGSPAEVRQHAGQETVQSRLEGFSVSRRTNILAQPRLPALQGFIGELAPKAAEQPVSLICLDMGVVTCTSNLYLCRIRGVCAWPLGNCLQMINPLLALNVFSTGSCAPPGSR